MRLDDVLPEKTLRRLVRSGLFPLRVIATVYWLSLGWLLHRPNREERETLRIARATAAAAAGTERARSEPTAAGAAHE
ncbi:hypothetical protein ABT167_35395 [Streptomyces sp. NPDC001792]|uniref:hypothetical protein n=1 Tax=Streptomyces sp. NPDC001792 TaxID=3154524 RepID=UPI003334600B